MNIIKILVLFTLTVVFGSCGGGGSGSFAGVWRVSLSVRSNSCDQAIETFDALLTVNQVNDLIAVEFNNQGGGVTAFSGFITGPDSFTSTSSFEVQCIVTSTGQESGVSSVSLLSMDFTNIDGDSAFVTYSAEIGDCRGDFDDDSCVVIQQGPATKVSG